MAVHNTSSDSANTAVRAFLTKVGEYYWRSTFNIGSGSSKKLWIHIRDEIFEGRCIYCGDENSKLQVEHLIMFNRQQHGLHHPGNVGPCCVSCNKRKRDDEKNYLDWESHLKEVCIERGEPNLFDERRTKIKDHMTKGKYKYPLLNAQENHAIRVIASALYQNVKTESDKALDMYMELDQAFVQRSE